LVPEQKVEMSFLDHLESMRWHIIRSLGVTVAITIIVFLMKQFVFEKIVFAPKNIDFITYKTLCLLSEKLHLGAALCITKIGFSVINIDMAGQFLLHLKVSFMLGLVIAFPYVLWETWRFIKPALHEKEIKTTRGIIFFSSLLFFIGVAFGYYILTPFSINFLGSYSIADEIVNTISLNSYIAMLIMLVVVSGLIFELPIIIYFLAKLGLITDTFMKHYRKHAFVVILVVAAILTPPDVTSQVLIAMPLYFLYEVGIIIAKKVYPKV